MGPLFLRTLCCGRVVQRRMHEISYPAVGCCRRDYTPHLICIAGVYPHTRRPTSQRHVRLGAEPSFAECRRGFCSHSVLGVFFQISIARDLAPFQRIWLGLPVLTQTAHLSSTPPKDH